MTKLHLIHHLASGASKKSPKTIAPILGCTEQVIKDCVTQVNADKEFHISKGKGGGLTLSGGLKDERATYLFVKENVEKWIAEKIYRNYGATAYHLKSTHALKLSGKWSTPDFTVLCSHKFAYAAPTALEVVSVEVKHTGKQLDVVAVYEALAHTRVSNYSILYLYDDPRDSEIVKHPEVFEEIKFACASNGIGLIVSNYISDVKTWNYVVMPKRNMPDPRKVDGFLEAAFQAQADRDWFKKNH